MSIDRHALDYTIFPRIIFFALCLALGSALLRAADAPKKNFHVAAGDASVALGEFAKQSGEQVIFLVDNVRGQQTQAVDGVFTSFDALQHMLSGTALVPHRDEKTGAMSVSKQRDARTEGIRPETARTGKADVDSGKSELVSLPEFTVSSERTDPYRATDAISAVRVRAPLLDTASSISVLTRDVIDDLAPTRIFDVTRYVAGIQEGRGIQFQDRQIIRGFEANGGRTVDNFLQANSSDNFDEVLIDRIEISKGPNAILSPAGVPGGSINVITKSPSYDRSNSVTGVIGLFDAQKVSADLTGAFSNGSPFAYRLIAAAQDSRRYWANDARLRGKVLAPMLTYRASDRTQITFKAIYADHWIYREPALILDPHTGSDTSPPLLAPGFSYQSRNGVQPWSHVGTQSLDGFFLLTSRLNDHINLRVAANYRYYFEDSTQVFLSTPSFTNRYNPTTGELTQDYTWAPDATGNYIATYSPYFDSHAIPVRPDTQRTTVRTATGQTDLVGNYDIGTVSSQTVSGLAWQHFSIVNLDKGGTLPAIDLSQPNLLSRPVWASSWGVDNLTYQTSWQMYINERLGFWANRIFLNLGGLHYDVHAKSYSGLTAAPTYSILNGARNMWLGSLLFKVRDNISIYYDRSTNSTPVIANNLPLWRDGQQHEVGLKSEFFNQRLSFNVAYFRIKQTNVTIPNPEHQTDPNAPEQLISNLGDHGVEFELTGGITKNLSVLASLTELRLRDSLGRRVRAVADQNAGLLLNYRFTEGTLKNLSLNFGVDYAGKRPGDTPAVNFTPLGVVTKISFYIPSYYTTDFGASYKWDRYTFRLNIDNVFDDHDYLQQAGGRVSGTGLTTAEGINIRFQTTLSF